MIKFWKKILGFAFAPLYFGGGGSKQSAPTVQDSKTTTEPWVDQQPHLRKVFSEAENIYDDPTTPSFFAGDTFTPYSKPTLSGIQGMQDIAAKNILPQVGASESFKTLSGQYLDPKSNPYIDRITQEVTGDVTSAVNSVFNRGGRFGSDAHINTLTDKIAGATAPIYGNLYDKERLNMMRAGAFTPQMSNLLYDPAQRQIQAGSMLEQKSQEELQDAINRHNFEQFQPQRKLADYGATIAGNYGGTTTGQTSMTQPIYGGSAMQGALGGALSGAGLASTLGMSNPYTAAFRVGGALLGGLFS